MLHIVPILCLIFFVLFVEFQLKRELHNIYTEFRDLKNAILSNKKNILDNRTLIDKNSDKISELKNKKIKL